MVAESTQKSFRPRYFIGLKATIKRTTCGCNESWRECLRRSRLPSRVLSERVQLLRNIDQVPLVFLRDHAQKYLSLHPPRSLPNLYLAFKLFALMGIILREKQCIDARGDMEGIAKKGRLQDE